MNHLRLTISVALVVAVLVSSIAVAGRNENYSGYYVGYKKINVASESTAENFPLALVYPTNIPSEHVKFGPFDMELSVGAKIAKGKFPLVVISHGSGGTNVGHRSVAFALVKNGYIVGMPLHPKNNYKNNLAEGSVENWTNRPKHISSAIDALLSDSDISVSIDSNKVAVIGHSAGGYTALAVAGGKANTGYMIELCKNHPQLNQPFCGLVKDTRMKSVDIENHRDDRVKAIVLMAPVGILFNSKEALAQVEVPALLLKAEKDTELIEPYHSEVIINNYKDKSAITYRTIENAGHYSFITPFPEGIKNEIGVVAEDPVGFNRKAFHDVLGLDIVKYLTEVLDEKHNHRLHTDK
jgi:predicted dienelactone hydrolase